MMRRYRSINLNVWLPVIILCAFALMLAVSTTWRYEYLAARLEQNTQERIKSSLANLQHRLEALLRSNHEGLVAEEIADFGSSIDVNSLVMLDDYQQVRHATQRIWLHKPASTVIPGFDGDHFSKAQQDHILVMSPDPLHDRILAYQPISLAARPGEIRATQTGVLLLDHSLISAKAEIRHELWIQAISNLAVSAITMILLMLILQRWLSRPLNYLREAVKRISQGNFKTEIAISGSGELAELGAAVNKMQADLANARSQSLSSIQMLRARERELKKITDALPGPISRVDETGRYIFVSAAYQRWFGRRPEEVIGKSPRDMLGAELHALLEPHLKLAHAGEQSTFEVTIANPAGGMRDAMVTVLPDFDSEGGVCGYYTICVDITERKRAEERFRCAVEAAPNAMIMVDTHSIITLANARTSSMFGYTQDELIGQPINLLIPQSYHTAHSAHTREFFNHATGRPMGLGRDLHGQHKDGHEIPVEVGLNPLQTNEGRFVIASVLDITERKLAMEKMQEKNAELERYAHMVSHDLKSPLVTIKTFLGYLKEDMSKGDQARIEKDMDFMAKAADKMGQLLDELLEMSRIGRIVSMPVHITWRDAVQEALNINAGIIAQRDVMVTVDGADISLFGERPRLVQIWQNLIDNAVKFLGDQPAPQIRIGVEQGERSTVFYVCDNGIGVDTRYHDKIFGMFEKLDAKVPGSGLGLALVKRIVQLYRGEISITSQGVGHGACFRFTLPEALKNEKTGESP